MGHENAEGMAHDGVHVERPVRQGGRGTAFIVASLGVGGRT